VSGVDRSVAGGEHQEQRGLRLLQAKDRRVGVRRLDRLDVGVPVLSRIDPQLGGRVGRLAEHVERELHVLGREGLAVVPLDALAEEEDEIPVMVLPRPLLGQLADDRVDALGLLQRIEQHEVIQTRHGRPHGRDRRRLVDGEALGQVLSEHHVQDPAWFWSRRRLGSLRLARGRSEKQRGESQDCDREERDADARH